MKKTIRLTESELISLVKRVIKEQEGFDYLDDTPIEDESDFDKDEDIEDFGFDMEDEPEEDDEFQNRMKFKERMKKHTPQSVGIGRASRWDKETEREIEQGGWSPIKPSDMPLEKYLKSKGK